MKVLKKGKRLFCIILACVIMLTLSPTETFAAGGASHTHSWSSEWRSNDTYHWHNCTAADCDVTDNGKKEGYGAHVFDNKDDIVCDVCGYTKPINCNVTFRTYGGSSVASQTILAGGKVTKPADPTRGSDTFLGWYTDTTFSTPFDFENTTILGDTSLCAMWSSNYVRFSTYGGSGTYPEQTIPAGGKVTKPADPTKDGVTFLGWYVRYTDDKPFDFENDTINVNTILRAAWSHNTVEFYRATPTIESQNVPFGGKITKPADPEKEGYTFRGWSDHTAFFDEFDFDTPIYSETVLYAYFTPITYQVSFFTFGGSSVENQTISAGGKVTKPADPTRKTDSFLGWYTDSTCNTPFDFENTTINSNMRLYAKWSSNTVTFRANNGTSNTYQTVPAGGKVTKPADPTKDGATFMGWYSDATFSRLFDFENDTVNSNMDLRAGWSNNLVYFNYSTIDPQTVKFGEKMIKPADPIPSDGLEFKGWSTYGGGFDEFDFETPIYSDTYLYAWYVATRPALQGTVSIIGTPKIGGTVSVDTSGITSIDPGTLTYQWYYMDGYYTYNIENSNSTTITIAKGATKNLYVRVIAENYSQNLTSEPKYIERGECTTVPVAATVTNTTNSVTVTNVTTGQEYVITKYNTAPSAGWKNAADFDGIFADLDTNNTYKVFTRVAQTNQYNASEAVETSVTLHSHAWATAWMNNGTHHWHECTAEKCDVTDNIAKEGYGAHVYDKQVATDTYKVTDATCIAKATYYYSCECGAKDTKIFEYGEKLLHTFGEWQKDEVNHWKSCSCGEMSDFGAHVYDGDADTTCNKCGYERTIALVDAVAPTISTQPVGATYTKGDTAAVMTIAASIDDAGTLSYQWYKNGTAISGATLATLDPSTATTGTNTYYCIVTNTNAAATGNKTATAKSNEVTITVNEPLHVHVYDQKVETFEYLKVPATCTAPAEYYFSCTCHEAGTETFTVGTALGHRFDNPDWGLMEAGGHAHICTRCGIAHDAIVPHVHGAPATETTAQTCTECGYVIAPALGHTHAPVLHPKKDPTTTEEGKEAYYECSCGKYYEDAAGTVEIPDIDAYGIIAKLTDPATPPVPTPTPAHAPAPAPEVEKKTEVVDVYYYVVTGDYLNKIARQHNITLAQILEWNPVIKNPNLIYKGQRIKVGTKVIEITGTAQAAPAAPAQTKIYSVVRGDNLTLIARKHGMTLARLYELNPAMMKRKYIYAGEKIVVE